MGCTIYIMTKHLNLSLLKRKQLTANLFPNKFARAADASELSIRYMYVSTVNFKVHKFCHILMGLYSGLHSFPTSWKQWLCCS